MPDEDRNVTLAAWPNEPVKVEHDFGDTPVPVAVAFESDPARVRISNDQSPLEVDMAMRLSAERPVPICITVCEPICARSKYHIGITIFDRPVADITVEGETRFFACDEKGEPSGGRVEIRKP